MTQPPSPAVDPLASAPPAGTRRALVESAARAWIAQLVDLSGRNRLLYYRDQKVGTPPPAAPVVIPAPARGPRPRIFHYGSINGMPPTQVDAVVAWIESDGLLRTSDEVVTEATRELGLARRGPRIVAAIEASVDRTRARREGR